MPASAKEASIDRLSIAERIHRRAYELYVQLQMSSSKPKRRFFGPKETPVSTKRLGANVRAAAPGPKWHGNRYGTGRLRANSRLQFRAGLPIQLFFNRIRLGF